MKIIKQWYKSLLVAIVASMMAKEFEKNFELAATTSRVALAVFLIVIA